MRKANFHKILVLTLVSIFVFSPLFAIQAQAQFVVVEVGPLAYSNVEMSFKERLFDALAFGFMNYAIQRMAASTVNWINRGFKGGPSFVTNPEGFLKDVADQTVGAFIEKDPNLNFLCAPIQSRIRVALINSYNPNMRNLWQCTLTDAVGNMEDFLDDFDRGGWDKFFEISQKPQNTPIGAYIMAENEMLRQIASKVGVKKQDFDWGKGFMSFKSCAKYAGVPESARTVTVPVKNPDGTFGNKTEILPDTCAQEKTETPGTVIESRLNQALGAGQGRLEVADEVNELIGALLTQLANKALGGLLSLTKRGSDGSNPYLSQFQSDAQDQAITQYFQDSQNNLQDTANTTVFDMGICLTNPSADGCPLNWQNGGDLCNLPVRPTDNDCSLYSDCEISNWATQASSNSGVSFEQAVLSLDCEPR